jgi:hypothetical protein
MYLRLARMDLSSCRLLLCLAFVAGAAEASDGVTLDPPKAAIPGGVPPAAAIAGEQVPPSSPGARPAQPDAPSEADPKPPPVAAVEMEKMEVVAGRTRIPSKQELEVSTAASKAALLRSRYPGASFRGQDPEGRRIPNYAALMYRDDERLRRIDELERVAEDLSRVGDKGAADTLRKEARIELRRRPDAREEAMDRSVNNDRR